MRKYLILFILFGCFTLQAQTKNSLELDDWTETASNTVAQSSELDVSGMFSLKIHIQHALTTDATAQDNGAFIIQVASETGASNEDWHDVMPPLPMVTGTPNTEALTATEPIGETVIAVASTTGLYTNDGARWMLLKDNTLAVSEMIYVVSAVSNTSVTILDGLTAEHTSADVLWDIAASRSYYVDVYQEDRLRIVIDNSLDAGGPQVTWRIRYSEVTAN